MSPIAHAPSVLIRPARASDAAALERLAALDSSSVPSGELLVAEADGELVAARSATNGAAIADPFRETAGVVALLALRARGLTGARRRRRGLRSLAPRMTTRTA